MKVVMGQLNTFVGDVAGNTEKVIQAAQATGAEEGLQGLQNLAPQIDK